jgi:hypothetical protein
MLRRSERITNKNIPNESYCKLRVMADTFIHNIQTNGSKKSRVYIINKLYSILYNEFYQIRDDIHNSHSKKEEFFISLIKIMAIRGNIILDELTKQDKTFKTETLKKNIVLTLKKIEDYLGNHTKEKKETFLLLSSKIGVDLIPKINSYLLY